MSSHWAATCPMVSQKKTTDMCRLSRSKKLTGFVRGSYTFLHHLDDFSIYVLVLYEIEILASF